jgi:hypothetical protein
VILAALGLSRPDFPGGPRGERVVIAISVGLVALAIASGILGGLLESGEEGEPEAAAAAARA